VRSCVYDSFDCVANRAVVIPGTMDMSYNSFSKRLRAGASPEALMRHYALSPGQYDTVVKCPEDIKKKGGNQS